MLLTLKGRILEYLKTQPRTWKEICIEFGNSGSVANACNQLIHDNIVFKPKIGTYQVVPGSLKSSKRK